jgi:hypothetical protein
MNHTQRPFAMKQTLILAFALLVTASSFAADVNDKVLKNFKETFTTAENVRWQEYKEFFSVSFMQSGIRTTVNYDKKGNMIGSLRYYEPHMLPLNIINQLKKDYPKRSLFGVTEISYGSDINYYVKLQDEKTWITVKVDPTGENSVVEKFNKQ